MQLHALELHVGICNCQSFGGLTKQVSATNQILFLPTLHLSMAYRISQTKKNSPDCKIVQQCFDLFLAPLTVYLSVHAGSLF